MKIEVVIVWVIKFTMCQINIKFSRDELLVINASLNEVCNRIELFDKRGWSPFFAKEFRMYISELKIL